MYNVYRTIYPNFQDRLANFSYNVFVEKDIPETNLASKEKTVVADEGTNRVDPNPKDPDTVW